MDIGIGLPATIPGVDRAALLDWARRAEDRGFSTLGVIDRLVYGNLEPLLALTAAAAVTERIGLTTSIMIAPYRANTALMAKQLLTLDAISGGRLTVGIAVGGREDDFEASHVDFSERGKRFDAQLDELDEIFGGADKGFAGPIGPPPTQDGGPPLILGGTVDAAIRRTVAHGAGWIAGGSGPDGFAEFAGRVKQAWSDGGRPGRPRLLALGYYALGDRAEEAAQRYLNDYYGFLGEEIAGYIVQGAAKGEEELRALLDGFGSAECDEIILFPCSTDVGQVDALADVAL